MKRSISTRLVLVLFVCIFLLTACESNNNLSNNDLAKTSSTQSSNQPPKGWNQNPDSDFDYRYDSDLQGVVVSYKGDSPKVWFPTTMNGDPIVSIGGDTSSKVENKYNPGIIEEVYIPEGIRNIGPGAFEGCTNLKNIVIPDGVERIGYASFEGCTNLETVILPDSVTAIDGDAFWKCGALTNINMPKNLKIIGSRAFGHYPLSELILPEGLEVIEYLAFMGGSEFTALNIPSSIKSIGDGAFSGCNKLATITLTDQDIVMDIANGAFENTYWYEKQADGFISLGHNLIGYKGDLNSTILTIPDGIKSIGSYNNSMQKKVEKLNLPEGLEYIGDYKKRWGLSPVFWFWCR